MSYDEEVRQAIGTLIDLCVFEQGQCNECKAQYLCNSEQPKDLASVNLSDNTTKEIKN